MLTKLQTGFINDDDVVICVLQARMLHYYNTDGAIDVVLVVRTERHLTDICSGNGGPFMEKHGDIFTDWFSSGE